TDVDDNSGATQSLDQAEPAGGFDVDDLPVSLVFVGGEVEVPLRDLQRMAPGYVFELPRPVDGHVEVRANGTTIGRGELVEIDGRVGVRILDCSPNPGG
ncbi:MAG: FliM/FliN family flagellar motor switch protein, partial [Rhodospirillaceae bacterium]|nr:FliM/FliN family flagellar motor switch protein [Rhodospirillaceae bacterium]